MEERITRRYLAGLLDGEGYFGILKPYKPNRRYFIPVIKMALSIKDAEILKEICLKLGGHLNLRKFDNPNHNDAWMWDNKTFIQVRKVLDYVHPYLIIKKCQADILDEFLKTKFEGAGKYILMPEEIRKKREYLYSLMRKLNHRGKMPPAETKCETPTVKTEDEAIVRTSEKSEEVDRNVNSTKELVCV